MTYFYIVKNQQITDNVNLQQKILSFDRPFIIAGPCSAESEEQVRQTVEQLASKTNTQLLRAGIWKPRTRPDSFEGVGTIGLKWLVDAGRSVGLPTTVEVANKYHVEEALKAGVDVCWIGARTTVNPFAVQEIADVLKGVKMPVLIKNPVNPDLELWIGAFERFEKAGLTDLTAVHRGFSVYKHPKYRNVPNWEIPISFRERMPFIPLICDPSHISGQQSLLFEVSQKAMDLNFEGLMIETHINPDVALSDAKQQLTPDSLSILLEKLVMRDCSVTLSVRDQLIDLRDKIAMHDDKLFETLVSRMQISEQIGQLKQQNNITVLQQEHWEHLLKSRLEANDSTQLSEQFIRSIMDAVHQESIRHQMKIMNTGFDWEK